MPFLPPLCTSCDIISVKAMPPSGGAHLQLHCIKIWSLSDEPFLSYQWLCTTPIAVAFHWHVNLLIYFTWIATHGLPSVSTCTTPYIQLGCKWPDARVSPIQVPAWDLDPNLQDQGWGKTWLSTLHSGQRGLCCHGQMGTSGRGMHEWPQEVLRLHREHIRWWDLPMSPCLWARRHHKEVWQIHWWASRSDMPTCLQGTNWQWQWCCNWMFNAGWFGQYHTPTLSYTINFWRSAMTRRYHIY